MSIADQITRLNNAKAAIKQAIESKGVTVKDTALLDEYPALIDSIEVGSGGEGGGDPYYENLHNQRTNNGTNFNYYFYYYPASELDVSKLDTSKATNMNSMFMNSTSLTSINGIESMNVSNVSDMGGIFDTCSSLFALDLSDWDMKNVININRMFGNCSGLTSLNVSGWDIHKIASLDSVFCYSGIQTLDLSSWDVSNITNMYYLFGSCYNLATVNLSGWDTSNVENMGSMFSSCNQLQSLDLSGWDTSKVTNFSGMFSYMQSYNLPSLDLSSFNTSSATDPYSMGYMFNWCNYLQELDIRNFTVVSGDRVTSMLEGCNSLHKLHLENCDNTTISNIINYSGMPQEQAYINGEYVTRKIYCKETNAAGLTAPNGWEFSYVTEEGPEVPVDPPAGDIPLYVPGEFANNEEITEVRTMVTSDHTDLSYMFNNCFNLISVNTEDWDTSNVTNMNGMFNNCYKLTSLDLRNFDISDVTNTECILQGCNSLKELHLDNCSNVTISKIINDPYVPTGGMINFDTGQMENRKIYCKASEIGDLVAPNGWEFVPVE